MVLKSSARRRKDFGVLKIVVFDSGYGGEFFADRLATELPVVEILRVINWRDADELLTSPHAARKIARDSLKPYIGRVDLIIFANYLLSLTSLKYFQRKFKNQKFLGLGLKTPDAFIKYDTLILSTKAVSRTINFHNYLFHLNRNIKILNLDTWPAKIDDGELTVAEIQNTFELLLAGHPSFRPREIILASSQFSDIKPGLKKIFGQSLKIYDGFDDTIRCACKTLGIRGGVGKKLK